MKMMKTGLAAAVAVVVWLYHWRETVPLGEHGGTLRRWYVYGSAFVGFLLLLSGSRAVLQAVCAAERAQSGSRKPGPSPMRMRHAELLSSSDTGTTSGSCTIFEEAARAGGPAPSAHT